MEHCYVLIILGSGKSCVQQSHPNLTDSHSRIVVIRGGSIVDKSRLMTLL